ncbi:MAG: PhoX family phosphatase [Rhodospirillaceae bacterium]|nr:PhoX family phosphatase [Rhodospirillaceae bacterium]
MTPFDQLNNQNQDHPSAEEKIHNPTQNPNIYNVINTQLSRRGLLKGLAIGGFLGTIGSSMASKFSLASSPTGQSTFTFAPVSHGIDDTHHVAEGYNADILIRWGDAMFTNAADLKIDSQTAASQQKQFGYNCDFIGYLPLPLNSNNSDHGVLFVNHEYTNTELMFPNLTPKNKIELVSKEQSETEMEGHGASIVEVKKVSGKWQFIKDSTYNRRLTITNTAMRIAGPAAGHDRMKTAADPKGLEIFGTLANCAGGVTPWGTVLTGEENFHGYFGGDINKTQEKDAYKRYGLGGFTYNAFFKYSDRFHVEKTPNEPNRFGWIVEVDPYDPTSTPVKQTALGRFKHEGANIIINYDGHVIAYMGDDERFEYIYKFVSANKFIPNDRKANMRLLETGTLYVAQFLENGLLEWLPLVYGQGKLTKENGFNSQADVVIEARRAADILGATPMDRPEDIEPNPVNGKVYVMLTNNSKRTATNLDAANPNVENLAGHIIEMVPPSVPGKTTRLDHTKTGFSWNFFLLAGKPGDGKSKYGANATENDWFYCPDNVAFDNKGRMWIATDSGSDHQKFGTNDGLYATDIDGAGKAAPKMFFRCPIGAEMCGPFMTPDNKTLFVAIQHPGEDSTFDNPTTRWPDFKPNIPPRPTVMVITKKDNGDIGT